MFLVRAVARGACGLPECVRAGQDGGGRSANDRSGGLHAAVPLDPRGGEGRSRTPRLRPLRLSGVFLKSALSSHFCFDFLIGA